nr:MAG TPA: hypothetical protein [Caudoviricetes sp.]
MVPFVSFIFTLYGLSLIHFPSSNAFLAASQIFILSPRFPVAYGYIIVTVSYFVNIFLLRTVTFSLTF